MDKELSKVKKLDFISQLREINYKVKILVKDYSQIIVTGLSDSIRINLKYTKMYRYVDDVQQIWFGISKRVIKKCDYVVLIPLDSKGFYILSCRWLENNLYKLYKTVHKADHYTFELLFSEEKLKGRDGQYINLEPNCFCILDKDLEEYNNTERKLPNFPKL